MIRWRQLAARLIGLSALLSCLSAGGTAQAAVGAPQVVTPFSPSPGVFSQLNGVAALSGTNAWADGYYLTSSNAQHSLIEHWNGTAWATVSHPYGTGNLLAISADTPTDVWAVGFYPASSGPIKTLILHWNGTVWAKISSPSLGTCQSELRSVSVVSSTDAWAVGDHWSADCTKVYTLVLHWNGTSWSKVTAPSPSSTSAFLTGVSADSSLDAWATGQSSHGGFMLHWNGTAWSRVSGFSGYGSLNNVNADSATDAWALGDYYWTLHWNGSAWSRTTPLSGSYTLYATSARTPTDAWLAGTVCSGSGCSVQRTLTLHWDGTGWSRIATTNPSRVDNVLNAVSADSATDAWASGYYCASSCNTSSEVDHTLIFHWNGTSWSRT